MFDKFYQVVSEDFKVANPKVTHTTSSPSSSDLINSNPTQAVLSVCGCLSFGANFTRHLQQQRDGSLVVIKCSDCVTSSISKSGVSNTVRKKQEMTVDTVSLVVFQTVGTNCHSAV